MKTRRGQARLIELLLAVALVGTFFIAYNSAIGGLGVINVQLSKPPISAQGILTDLANRGVLDYAFANGSLSYALSYLINAVRVTLPTGYVAEVAIETYRYNSTLKAYEYIGAVTGYTHENVNTSSLKGASAAFYLYLDESTLGARVYIVRVEVYELGG